MPYTDKLRAICLFEADFNWLQKLILAKRMMTQATVKGVVPAEQCAKARTNPIEGLLIKLLYNDIHRTLHVDFDVVSADLANCYCYDVVDHAICSIALRAFGVPFLAI